MKLPRGLAVPEMPHGAGSRAEFESCLEEDFPALAGQLYAITMNARAAREHVQDAYAEAWRQWSVIRDLPDPASWVRAAAIGYSRAWVRRAGQRAGSAPEGPWPPTTAGSRALFGALATLAEDGRRSLVLYHVAGLPLDVVANIEQVTIGDVQARLSGSHDKLLGGIREAALDSRAGTAGRGRSGGEGLVAASAWDEDKTAALRSLVAELASSVATPAVSTIVRRAGSQHRATSAAAIAVLAVGALGAVTIAVSTIGEPPHPPPGVAIGVATTAPPVPTLIPAEPALVPTVTRTRSPIARPRATPRPTVTTTSTTPTTTDLSETTTTTRPSSSASIGAD